MELFEYLKSANKSLFRFESFQDYVISNEDMSDESMEEWWNFIIEKIKSGVTMQRVRLLVEPLNTYTKNELEVHKKSKSIGDDIRTMKENIFNTLYIDREDFWLIDNKIVLKMNYSVAGEYEGFEAIENSISTYIEIKNLLLRKSTSL